MRFSLLATCLAVTSAFADEAAPAAPPKLGVLPFAALSSEVPARAGVKVSGMLATEFKNAEGLQYVDLRKSAATSDPYLDGLLDARKAVDEAKDLRKKKKFRLASEALVKAINGYKTNAGGVADVGEVVDAYALLSAVQYNTGRDEDGQKSLATALALAPDRDLPLAATSQLFARVVADTRKSVKDAGKGMLHLETTPSGAAVVVDGIALGNTPLQVKDVPPGLHFWHATLPNGEVLGGVAEVSSGKTAKVSVVSQSKDPESRLLASVSQNRLDKDVVAAAKELAGAGGVDVIVFGALSKEGKGLALDTFLFSAEANEVRRLPRAEFDMELLSAGVEFFKLAGQLVQKGAKSGEVVKVPGNVLTNLGPQGVKVAEAKYGVQPGKENAIDLGEPDTTPVKDEGPRKPLGDGKRVPLKKKP